ncbi:hypothetical protein Pcinc_034050 [Petrolisthes cinctipes]|uniref:Phosphatidylinositol-glycan biosynthesis class W protein n=1 Tax=Petrolisthes cinctipes TaxID=88211 RepID=A0AAE1ER57_PETCI|nr:hypothetical protein Pcinc_034050 [Petrolisthes cinctipes]
MSTPTPPVPTVREAHEAFVSGHSGSSAVEVIQAVWVVFPALVVTAIVVQGRIGWWWFMGECVIIVLPLVLSFTSLANYTLEMWLTMTALAASSLYLVSQLHIPYSKSGYVDKKRVGCVTSLRGMLNLVATVAILAVDFRSFPRRFAKTEEYGYSLMDTGAIGFVIANGVVEGRKRCSLWFVVRDGVMLTILGVGRLWLTRMADYQHHITEYGLHANFFFTLAFVKVSCSWWAWRLKMSGAVAVAVCLCMCHHLWLTAGGGEALVFGPAPRDTLFLANREWVVSMPGYLASYFMGLALGSYIFSSSVRNNTPKLTNMMVGLAVCLFGCVLALHNYLGPPSRRLANPTFVLFAMFFSILALAHYLVAETLVSSILPGLSAIPVVFHAINRRPLLCFLLANVITGIINKTINTLAVDYPWDVCIIATYTLGITAWLAACTRNTALTPSG